MSSAKPVIEVTDVCFAYDREEVLHNANMCISAGDIVAVVGPNGGGKSTLLKLILGILQPSLGRIRVLGQTPQKSSASIGYVPQHISFDQNFPVSVLDVVLMGRVDRSRFGFYSRHDKEISYQALEQVHLQGFANRPFSDLSGGERQRVLIAQALATGARILLLDEPTANVDSVAQRLIFDLLLEINHNTTIIMVSHNLNVVTTNATHIACVNHTCSMVPVDQFNEETIDQTFHPGLRVLHHGSNCPVINPTQAMKTPHNAGDTVHGEHTK